MNMTTLPPSGLQGVGGSNPLSPTNLDGNLLQSKLVIYLQEMSLLRKPETLREARRICYSAISSLNPNDPRSGVLNFLVGRKGQGIEPRTLDKERIRLCAFLKHAGYTIKIPRFKFVQRKPEAFQSSEIEALIGSAEGRDKLLWRAYLQSGLRLQEMMNLEYENLLDGGIEVVPHGGWTPKSHEERVVRVPAALIAELRGLPRIGSSKLVFPSQRGGVNWHHLRSLKRCAKRAGLDPATVWVHKWRATFATTLLRRGVGIRELMAQMGHNDLKSTMRYLAVLGDNDLQMKIENVWNSH